MGFEIEVVDECPVTKGSSGVLTMTREHIAMIAGAVRDKIEWMVLLHGERSDDGYEVTVQRFTVPAQYRSSGEVELAQDIVLPDDCVGVMHSHHRMGAFFSSTDRNELNPRFPSSIVVAVANNNLGFDYRASGKVKLPCGAMGLVDFELAVAGVERFAAEAVKGQHADLSKDGLKGCTHRYYAVHPENAYLAVDQTQCGLTVGEEIEMPLVFGMDGAELMAAVVSQTRQPPTRQGSYTTGRTNLSNYWERRKREQDEALSALDQAKGKRRKGKKGKGKYSAQRNGLVKLERPEPQNASQTHITGNCDDCGYMEQLEYIAETRDWLCSYCIERLAEDILAGTNSNDDRTLVVTDEIDMGEVAGWGI